MNLTKWPSYIINYIRPRTDNIVVPMLGKRALIGIWMIRLLLFAGVASIVISILLPKSVGNKFISSGLSIQLLSVPLLASAIFGLFARSRQFRMHGDTMEMIESEPSEAGAGIVWGFAVGPVLGLLKLYSLTFEKLPLRLAAIGLVLLVVGIVLQIIGTILL